MTEVVIVCGRWIFEKHRWAFVVDETGSRILTLDEKVSLDDFLVEVAEDFSVDRRVHEVVLSYTCSKKMLTRLPHDTPPVIISNHRQLIGYLRQTKVDPVRLCVELKEKNGSEKIKVVDEQRKTPVKKERAEVRSTEYEDFVKEQEVESGVKEEGEDVEDGESEVEDPEEWRFDYCEDSDGTTSDDEDYSVYGRLFEADDEDANKSLPVKKRGAAVSAGEEVIKAELSSIDLKVGQKFESKDALETRLKMLSVALKFDFDIDKSEPGLFTCHCWVEGCTWRLRASPKGNSREFYIRIYMSEHTCSITERFSRCRQATPEILGQIYKEFIGGVGPHILPTEVAENMNKRYGIKMDYWKAHRTLKKARELVRGTAEDGYKELPSYLYMIRRANPGTYTRLVVDSESRFKYLFLAFGGSLHGLPYMRKVVVVDGTFLQGRYKGTLLIATAQDGNFQIYPIGFGIVDTENDESWEWFFKQLRVVIPDDKELAIISDRHRSIGTAIAKVYPLAARGICTYHLHKNIMVRFRGSDAFGLVKKAARAYQLIEFNALFEEIQQLNPELHAYLIKADLKQWTRVHFPGDRYNFTTSNIAESINKVLTGARSFPVDKLLDAIRCMLTRWFAYRRKDANGMPTLLTRGVEKLLESRVDHARKLAVQEIDEHQWEVTLGETTHVVNLTERKCTCRRFEMEKIPCMHALAAATKAEKAGIPLCHLYYRTEYLRNAYSKSIMPRDVVVPVPDAIAAQVCLPPLVRQPPGRPKKGRMKSGLEVALQSKRPRKQHACSNCGKGGHNRTTCKARPV